MKRQVRHVSWPVDPSLRVQIETAVAQTMVEPYRHRQFIRQWTMTHCFYGDPLIRVRHTRRPWRVFDSDIVILIPPETLCWTDTRKIATPYLRSTYLHMEGGHDVGLSQLTDGYGYALMVDPERQIGQHMLKIVDWGRDLGEAGFAHAQAELWGIIALIQSARHEHQEYWRIGRRPVERAREFALEVSNYLHDHVHERFSVADIAKHFGLSETALAAQFRRGSGEPLMRAFKRIRIDVAKLLIRQGHTLGEVAEHTGFYDAFHLSKTFKRITGQSPRDYLKQDHNGS